VAEGPSGAEGVEAQVEGAGVASRVDRVLEGLVRVLIVVGSLILGLGYFLEWTTDIEDRGSPGSATGKPSPGGADADRGPSLAGLTGLDLPASLRVVGAPAPTVRFAYPDPSDGWLTVFEVAGNPLEAWGQLGRALAGDFDLPATHAACTWIVEGADDGVVESGSPELGGRGGVGAVEDEPDGWSRVGHGVALVISLQSMKPSGSTPSTTLPIVS
jgi:hypothetical protein